MIRKIIGKQSNTTIHHLEKHGATKITERVNITNRLAQEISQNSSSNNYHTKFKKSRKAEKEYLDFDTDNCENYNVQFTIRELCDALKSLITQPLVQIKLIINCLNIYQETHLWCYLIYLMIYGLRVKFLNALKRSLLYPFLNQAKTKKIHPIIVPYL